MVGYRLAPFISLIIISLAMTHAALAAAERPASLYKIDKVMEKYSCDPSKSDCRKSQYGNLPSTLNFDSKTGANLPNRGCIYGNVKTYDKTLNRTNTAHGQYVGLHTSDPQCEATFIPANEVCDKADQSQCTDPHHTITRTTTAITPNIGCPAGYVVGGLSINVDDTATIFCRPVVNFHAPSASYH